MGSMAQQPNRLLRVAVPLGLMLVAIGVAIAVLINSSRSAPNKDASRNPNTPTTAPSTPAPISESEPTEPPVQQAPDVDVAEQETSSAEEPEPAPAEQDAEQEPQALSGLHVRAVASAQEWSPIGGLDAAGSDRVKIEFSPIGAGVASLRLAGEFVDIESLIASKAGEPVSEDQHVQIQTEQRDGVVTLTPFAALWVEIDGTPVPLVGPDTWRELAPGAFEAIIEDEAGNAVAKVTRRYELTDGSNDLAIEQHIENLSDAPIIARFVQFGPIDLPKDQVTYGGDKRRVRFGYLLRPALDVNREFVQAKKFLTPRTSVLSPRDKTRLWTDPKTGKTFNPYVVDRQIWPNEKSEAAGLELVWSAMTNRYYGVAVHGVHRDTSTGLAWDLIDHIDRVVMQRPDQPKDGTIILRLVSKPHTVVPGESFDVSVALYAGPVNRPEIARSPAAKAAGIDKMVAYNFGGPCAACTFSWLSDPILGLLRFLHSVVHDWAIAIIILVFCVRGLLHPINRFSQIRMQRFAKQMQDLAPKQKKIQEKYGDDKQRAQQEMAKLWREEGVNPAGMLGCLPMLLQSPIWIALYATLYFLYDLRQEPAFFGIFQTISGG
ncbi:MAG TPA: membrane protein insertase YidC, partial [Phycisphaerales bacterium]|nr:membrane protein insertase YidC [Phycisphaerales bacterium]